MSNSNDGSGFVRAAVCFGRDRAARDFFAGKVGAVAYVPPPVEVRSAVVDARKVVTAEKGYDEKYGPKFSGTQVFEDGVKDVILSSLAGAITAFNHELIVVKIETYEAPSRRTGLTEFYIRALYSIPVDEADRERCLALTAIWNAALADKVGMRVFVWDNPQTAVEAHNYSFVVLGFVNPENVKGEPSVIGFDAEKEGEMPDWSATLVDQSQLPIKVRVRKERPEGVAQAAAPAVDLDVKVEEAPAPPRQPLMAKPMAGKFQKFTELVKGRLEEKSRPGTTSRRANPRFGTCRAGCFNFALFLLLLLQYGE